MNKLGFTIIECLVALLIITITIQCINVILIELKYLNQINESQVALSLVTKQLEEDLVFCQTIKTLNPFSCQTYQQEIISYKVNSQKLIRQINGRGYEIIFPKLIEYKVKDVGGMIKWKIKTEKEEYIIDVGVKNE